MKNINPLVVYLVVWQFFEAPTQRVQIFGIAEKLCERLAEGCLESIELVRNLSPAQAVRHSHVMNHVTESAW